MTREELGKIHFEWVSLYNLTDRYICVYRNNEYGVEVHNIVKRRGEFETGKSKQIFFYKNKEYKSVNSLLEAINDKEDK